MHSTYQLLKKYNLQANKSLGQNFLADSNHVEKIIKVAELTVDDIILEIGPGLGALTQLLIQVARAVVALEIDQRLLNILATEIRAANFYPIQGDMLTIEPATLLADNVFDFTPGDNYIVVGNLPYYITSAIIRQLLEAVHPPQRTIITIQKEVAQRIVARPGKMSLLAVSVQYYGRPVLCHTVSANAFVPPPKVDSAVLRIDRYINPPVTTDDPAHFFRIVKAGFSQKRKQLKNSLTAGLHKPQDQVVWAMGSAGIDPRRRAETLSLPEWAALAATFKD